MMNLKEQWNACPSWVNAITLLAGVPAWIGFAALIATGTFFDYKTLGVAFFIVFGIVAALRAFHSRGESDYELMKGPLAAIAVVVAIMLFALLLFREPSPPLPNNVAYGCYHSDLAPAIRLDEQGMHILQEGFPTIPYHLERHKSGIALTADRPIQAKANGERYEYSFYHPGIGTFLSFYRDVDGERYGVFEAENLSGFSMYPRSFASNHSGYIDYVKSVSDDC